MNLFDAHKQGLPLVAETRDGGARLLAEIFPVDAGVVFADVGWPDANFHAFHLLEGELAEDPDGWRVGETRIRVAFEGEQLHADWNRWIEWKRGNGFDRERCWREIQASGILETAAA